MSVLADLHNAVGPLIFELGGTSPSSPATA
jgi:hypothetical protein